MPRNAIAFEVKDEEELSKPGAYLFRDDKSGLTFGCPCGCGAHFGMTFKVPGADRGWTVTGEWPKASATPSLGCSTGRGDSFHWHGYLRDGVFEEC